MHFGRVLIFSETRLVIARGFRIFGQLQDKVSNTYLVKYPPNQYTDRFSKFSFNRKDVRCCMATINVGCRVLTYRLTFSIHVAYPYLKQIP